MSDAPMRSKRVTWSVVGTYERTKHETMRRMSTLLDRLMLTMRDYEGDFLGSAYMAGGFGNPRAGQYFTPYTVAKAMAAMSISRSEIERIRAEGRPLTLMEPASGTGVMVIAAADVIAELGFDPARVMLATLIDIDALCMQMAFLQMTMRNIPAICMHGNALALTELERAVTPAALLQRWPARSSAQGPTPRARDEPDPAAPGCHLMSFGRRTLLRGRAPIRSVPRCARHVSKGTSSARVREGTPMPGM